MALRARVPLPRVLEASLSLFGLCTSCAVANLPLCTVAAATLHRFRLHGTWVALFEARTTCDKMGPPRMRQTRVKHSVRQTPAWYMNNGDRATRGTRRVATPSRKWERAGKNDNLDQKLLRRLGTPRMKREDQNARPATHRRWGARPLAWRGRGPKALRRASEVRPYKPKPQRRALSGWDRGGAVAAQRGEAWRRRTNKARGPKVAVPLETRGRAARRPPPA